MKLQNVHLGDLIELMLKNEFPEKNNLLWNEIYFRLGTDKNSGLIAKLYARCLHYVYQRSVLEPTVVAKDLHNVTLEIVVKSIRTFRVKGKELLGNLPEDILKLLLIEWMSKIARNQTSKVIDDYYRERLADISKAKNHKLEITRVQMNLEENLSEEQQEHKLKPIRNGTSFNSMELSMLHSESSEGCFTDTEDQTVSRKSEFLEILNELTMRLDTKDFEIYTAYKMFLEGIYTVQDICNVAIKYEMKETSVKRSYYRIVEKISAMWKEESMNRNQSKTI